MAAFSAAQHPTAGQTGCSGSPRSTRAARAHRSPRISAKVIFCGRPRVVMAADQVGREAARCWSLRGQAGLNRASRSLGLEKIMLLGEHQPEQGDGEQQGQKHKRDDHHRQDSVQRHRAPCYPTRYLREEKFGPNFGPKLKSTGRYELI